jgi:hypothetical protein
MLQERNAMKKNYFCDKFVYLLVRLFKKRVFKNTLFLCALIIS